jgi:hypothetical protein
MVLRKSSKKPFSWFFWPYQDYFPVLTPHSCSQGYKREASNIPIPNLSLEGFMILVVASSNIKWNLPFMYSCYPKSLLELHMWLDRCQW